MLNMLAIAAAQTPSAGQGFLPMILMWGGIIAIFYFLLIRPQRQAQKKHQAMVAALKKGDDIMTDGGILGQVIHLADDRITIKTAENTRVVVARSKIQRVITAQAEAEAEAEAK
jgi:preprotein translocase subunit YajC